MLGVGNGTDAAEREQSVLAHYAESRGGKACGAGLTNAAEREQSVRSGGEIGATGATDRSGFGRRRRSEEGRGVVEA